MARFEQVEVAAGQAGNFDANGDADLTINHSFGNVKSMIAQVYVDDVMVMAPVVFSYDAGTSTGSVTVSLSGAASSAICTSEVKVNLIKVD